MGRDYASDDRGMKWVYAYRVKTPCLQITER